MGKTGRKAPLASQEERQPRQAPQQLELPEPGYSR